MARTCHLPVRDGEVVCPWKGSIDVELCYQCPRLRAFQDEAEGTEVVCAMPLWPAIVTGPELKPGRPE